MDVVSSVRRVQLPSTKFMDIQQSLEKRLALHPINRVELKTHSLPAGLTCLNWDNACNG